MRTIKTPAPGRVWRKVPAEQVTTGTRYRTTGGRWATAVAPAQTLWRYRPGYQDDTVVQVSHRDINGSLRTSNYKPGTQVLVSEQAKPVDSDPKP